jgi:L-amino acid N-acyltransferase YncA
MMASLEIRGSLRQDSSFVLLLWSECNFLGWACCSMWEAGEKYDARVVDCTYFLPAVVGDAEN